MAKAKKLIKVYVDISFIILYLIKLNICNAKITTVGEKAEDFFILTNENGIALSEEERGLLENVLYERL